MPGQPSRWPRSLRRRAQCGPKSNNTQMNEVSRDRPDADHPLSQQPSIAHESENDAVTTVNGRNNNDSQVFLDRIATALEQLVHHVEPLARIADILSDQSDPVSPLPNRTGQSAGADEWLSIAAAAQVAQVSEKTIRRAVLRGRLNASNVGGSTRRPTWRIQRTDLDAFLKANVAGNGLPATPQKFKGRYKSRHFLDL